MKPSFLKRLLFRLILLGFIGLIALVITEVLLRWQEARNTRRVLADASKSSMMPSDIPGLYYTDKPGGPGTPFGFNTLGFNMPERSPQKPPGVWRIIAVGDSVTHGYGGGDKSNSWPNRVDAALRARCGESVEVWNCGVGGYNVDQVFLMMSRIVTNYQPDAILYGFCFNDYWGPCYYLSGQAVQNAGAAGIESGHIGFLDRIKQLRTVARMKLIYDKLFYARHGYPPVFLDRKLHYPSWIAMKKRIVEMRDFCRDNGMKFAVLIEPMPQFIHVPDAQNLGLHDLIAHLEAEKIPYANATPLMRAHNTEDLFIPNDNHPNKAGYALLAQVAETWILSNRTTFLPNCDK